MTLLFSASSASIRCTHTHTHTQFHMFVHDLPICAYMHMFSVARVLNPPIVLPGSWRLHHTAAFGLEARS